jgi:SPP1 family predicted phage head-tail adaptor
MTFNPGEFRHRITIRQPGARTKTGTGYTNADPTVVASGLWAKIEPIDGYERIQAMQTQAGLTHRITIWYRSDITSAMEVVHRGSVYEIVEPPINIDEANERLQLLCKEL